MNEVRTFSSLALLFPFSSIIFEDICFKIEPYINRLSNKKTIDIERRNDRIKRKERKEVWIRELEWGRVLLQTMRDDKTNTMPTLTQVWLKAIHNTTQLNSNQHTILAIAVEMRLPPIFIS